MIYLLRGVGALGHKTSLGNELWGEVDSIKHYGKRLPLNWSSSKRSNLPQIWFWYLRFRIWGLEIKHQKSHNFVWQGCFFFHYYLATSMTDWVQIFTGWLFCADVEKTGLWQIPIVSTVFKMYAYLDLLVMKTCLHCTLSTLMDIHHSVNCHLTTHHWCPCIKLWTLYLNKS